MKRKTLILFGGTAERSEQDPFLKFLKFSVVFLLPSFFLYESKGGHK
jgi:hypothetical protein